MKHKGRNRDTKNRNKRRAWTEDTMWTNPQTVMILMKVIRSWILGNHRPWSVMKTYDSCVKLGGVKGGSGLSGVCRCKFCSGAQLRGGGGVGCQGSAECG